MSEIKLNEITSGTTIKEMVEIINSNFTKIVESGGGPTGVPGEDGVAGPEGKRGNGIFVIKDESEIDEGKEYEKEVNEFLKNDSSDSEEGKYKEGDCIIYKSGLYIVKISPDGDNTLVAEYMGTLKGEKGDKGETGSNEEEGGSSNQWKIVDINGNHYGYQFNGDYKFLIIGSGIDENTLGSYGAEEDYNHSLWILDGEKGIALYGKKNEDSTFSKGTITFSNDDKLMLTGARGVCVNGISFDKGEINYSGGLKLVTDFNTITLDNSGINLNSTTNGGDIKLNTLSNIEITNGKNHITLTSTLNITGEDITLKCSGQCNVSGTNVSGTNASLSGGEIVVDKTGVGLSGSGKSINIGVTALSGYDVDIVGKTYISGDLVVGGKLEVRTGSMYEIGDIRLWPYKTNTPSGWFSNSDILKLKGIPFFKDSSNTRTPIKYEEYVKLTELNDIGEGIPDTEFKDYQQIANVIMNKYKIDPETKSLTYAYDTTKYLDTTDNFLSSYDFFNKDEFKKYIDIGIDSIYDGTVYDKKEIGYKIINKDGYSLLIYFLFNFRSGTFYEIEITKDMTTILNNIKDGFSTNVVDFKNQNNWLSFIQNLLNGPCYAHTHKWFDNNNYYASIYLESFERGYESSESVDGTNRQNYYTIKDAFVLPDGPVATDVSSNKTYKYFKYIAKYKDDFLNTEPGVGRRPENKNGE